MRCTEQGPPGAATVQGGTLGEIAGTYELEWVWTGEDTGHRTSGDLLVLRAATASERVVPPIGGRPGYERALLGTLTRAVDSLRQHPAEVESEANWLYVGMRHGFDASPTLLGVEWRAGRAFGGRWANYLSGIAQLIDSAGRARDSIGGYYCAWPTRTPGSVR